jgi:hypothetical protein
MGPTTLDTNMSQRRFPPPWSVEELDACFVVKDRDGQQLAYVYFENEPGPLKLAFSLSGFEVSGHAVYGAPYGRAQGRYSTKGPLSVEPDSHIVS